MLPDVLFSKVQPARVPAPDFALFNCGLAQSLGLNAQACQSREGVLWFAGNKLPPGSVPLAQAYAGHQFGHPTMLGDGRALLLGEQITPAGIRVDIQLKGSGRTPYSRRGDGKAVLAPMLREYVISEFMAAIGIPTTRSLAVVTTGEAVWREVWLPGAVLTRTAASHLRVGTFEYASAARQPEVLRALAEYTLQRHYPELSESPHRFLALFRAILENQARLVARWMGTGFVHGVMNTDNMALSGETIDYGPCAFLEVYDPETVFSSIDHHGRYAYGRQPAIAHWNLSRLAEAMLPLFSDNESQAVETANELLAAFPVCYRDEWLRHFGNKLGLFAVRESDAVLIEDLLMWMRDYKADFTNTFRSLSPVEIPEVASENFVRWHKRWVQRLSEQEQPLEEALALMRRTNPAFIPRNQRVEEALTAAQTDGNLAPLHRLLNVLSRPFEDQPEHAEFREPAPQGSPPYITFCGT